MGASVRAVRLRKGWRQRDVAARAGVSGPTVSRIERGQLHLLSVGTLVRVAAALEIRIDWLPRWRGGELDRMINAGHAAMHDVAARAFARTGWTLVPEATFSIYGERGAIDILAYHARTGSLLVVELKTDIVDVQGLIGAVDRYRRLAPQLADDRGWAVRAVSCWVVLRESPSNRRRLAAHGSVLRTAFPDDGRRMRGWLREPLGSVRALSFLSVVHPLTARAGSSGGNRVRRRRSSVGAAPNLLGVSLTEHSAVLDPQDL